MAGKIRVGWNKLVNAYDLLNNSVTSALIPEQEYRPYAATFLISESKDFENRFKMLLKRPRFRRLYKGLHSKVEEFSENFILADTVSVKRILEIYKVLLEESKDGINGFVRARDEFEKQFLAGRFEGASAALEECREAVGESLWYVRSKILVLAYSKRADELEKFCEDCKKRTGDEFIRYIINCVQAITDSNSASTFLRSMVLDNVRELREARQKGAPSLLVNFFAPKLIMDDIEWQQCLKYIQMLPLVDQYCLILELAADSKRLDVGLEGFGEDQGSLNWFVVELSKSIEDKLLKRLCVPRVEEVEISCSSFGAELLNKYDEGQYGFITASYRRIIEETWNPSAYLNLVAKAYAFQSEIPSENGLIDRIILQLANLYALKRYQAAAEDELVSQIIKLKGFSIHSHLEIALVKALPHKYSGSFARCAATLSILSNPEVTPLTARMAFGGRQEVVSSGGSVGASPGYRVIKKKIYSALSEGDFVNAQKLLSEFEASSPLRRDVLEMLSDFCIATNKVEMLISECARYLVEMPESVNCFPMEWVVSEIEEACIATRDSVLVCYFFSRYVSQRYDHVLNEVFDEYINSSGVDRPSSILSGVDEISPSDVVFFRDVCVPDVMDYLSAFGSANELRAERVQVLDILLEKGVIDDVAYDGEVEEIYDQIIVDAGIREINGSKIFVSDDAIKRKCLGAVAELIAIYRSSKETEEERMVLMGDEPAKDGLLRVYVAGSKNAAVLKIVDLVLESFLFDEKHGLDKNLSTEIRHGFFSNLMRSSLQRHNVITEVDTSGNYKSNEHWRQVNSLVSRDVLDRIDARLKEFSAEFNSLLCRAEEWMKIGKDNHPERVFDYLITGEEFESIKSDLSDASEAEGVIEVILGVLWAKTEFALSEVRTKLSADFKNAVDALFDGLLRDVAEIKKGIPMVELMGAITQAKSDIKEDIQTAVEWFSKGAGVALKAMSLMNAIEVAVNTFKQVQYSNVIRELKFDEYSRLKIVPGEAVRPLIIAIINLLDNCFRRSGLGSQAEVEITAIRVDGGVAISVVNDLSLERLESLTRDAISEINRRMISPGSIELMRVEGGSGTGKAFNHIKSIDERNTLAVKVIDGRFCAEIFYAC